MSKQIHNRLSRISGQLAGLQQAIDDELSCEEIIPQFLAVRGALSSAFEAYMTDSIQTCPSTDKAKLQQLISLLIKK